MPTSKSSTFIFKLFALVGTLTSLLMSSLSTPSFKAMKSFWKDKSDISMPTACFSCFLVA